MKALIAVSLAVSILVGVRAQTLNDKKAPEAQIVEIGPHDRVWEETSVDANGVTNVATYTELATGLNFLNPTTGQWEESQEEFQIAKDGSAIAVKGQHQVVLTSDINAGASVDLLTPDGVRLVSNPMGLVFYDRATEQSVLIAEVKSCIGELIAPNMVVYGDAFDTVKAALRYTYTRGGFEQDVIFYEDVGSPADNGLNPESTVLEVWTEFHNPPTPERRSEPVPGAASDDETLSFGQMTLGRGVAYELNAGAQDLDTIEVSKSWVQIDGRSFLVESLPFPALRPLLEKSQVNASGGATSGLARVSFKSRNAMLGQSLKPKSKKKEVASIKSGTALNRRGVLIDYTTINTSQTDYLFKGDTTYYVSGTVNLSGGNNILEGGTVIKYTNTSSAYINVNGAGAVLKCQTSAYRPAVFTSKDDNSVGETIAGSTGNPSGFYGGSWYLKFDYNLSGQLANLHDIRVAYAYGGIGFNTGSGHTVTHAQFVNCRSAITATTCDVSLLNVLVNGGTNAVDNSASCTLRCANVTLHNIQNLYSYNASPPTRLFTNSLVVSVTNYATYSGVNNQTLTTDTGVFQSVGAGYHYLASGSAYRNIGTTNNVGASLLADLKKRTTYPPVILTSDFTTDTTLSPQAQRDIDTPDLGYHYDALDWCWGGRNLTNCTLTLTNGVAVGLYNTAATILRSNGKFVSEGLPACLNRIVRYQAVQEQSVVLGTVGSPMVFWDLATTTGQVRLRFSDVSLMADAYSRRSLVGNQGSQAINPLSISHSQLRGVYLAFSDSQSSSSTIIAMTNNIVERSTLSWSKTDSYYPFTLYQYNNLFRTGTNSYSTATAAASWTIKDNLFDCDSLTKTGAGSFTVSNNGYKSGLTSLGGTGNITGLVPDYQTGSLGGFYYPTSGGSTSLVNLSNAGSRTAGSATLYHFATTTNQAKEASTTVDIGYHYVAVDGAGNPIDTDGDGYSDCLEDWNGNGTFDTGESDWQTSNSGISGTAGLQVFTPLK